MQRETPPAGPRATGAGGGLHSVVTRHPALLELQGDLVAELGITRTTPAVQHLLDIVTIATATWYGRLSRGGRQVELLGGLVDLLRGATSKLGGHLRVESLAEARTWCDRAKCGEAALWAVVDATSIFHRAARAHFAAPNRLHAAVATALVLPPHLGGAQWQAARSPVGLVIDAARRHHRVHDLERGGGAIPRSDALHSGVGRGTVPLPITLDPDGTESERLLVEPALEMVDIDVEGYMEGMRAAGEPDDVVADIGAWLAGLPKADMGDARYQRTMYHLRSPRSRAIASRERLPRHLMFQHMATPNWIYSRPGRKDSVIHAPNARLLI